MLDLYQKNKLFFLVLLTAALGFLVWYFSTIVIVILVAGVISIIGSPLVELFGRIKIGRFKFPRVLGTILTLVLFLLLFFGLFSLFIPLVVNEVEMISNIDGKQLMAYFHEEIARAQWTMVHYGLMPHGATFESTAKQAVLKLIDFGMFSNLLALVITFTGSFFFNLFSVLFLSFFFMLDQALMTRFIFCSISASPRWTALKSSSSSCTSYSTS